MGRGLDPCVDICGFVCLDDSKCSEARRVHSAFDACLYFSQSPSLQTCTIPVFGLPRTGVSAFTLCSDLAKCVSSEKALPATSELEHLPCAVQATELAMCAVTALALFPHLHTMSTSQDGDGLSRAHITHTYCCRLFCSTLSTSLATHAGTARQPICVLPKQPRLPCVL